VAYYAFIMYSIFLFAQDLVDGFSYLDRTSHQDAKLSEMEKPRLRFRETVLARQHVPKYYLWVTTGT